MAPPFEPSGQIWVRTQPDVEGHYRLALELNDDYSVFLDEAQALAYADYVVSQVVFAEFDARVFAQMSSAADPNTGAMTIGQLRERRPVRPSPVELSLNPGVNPMGHPFLHVFLRGQAVGQWSVQDARSHAQAVLEGVHVAALENQYLDLLVKDLEIDESTARGAIYRLAN